MAARRITAVSLVSRWTEFMVQTAKIQEYLCVVIQFNSGSNRPISLILHKEMVEVNFCFIWGERRKSIFLHIYILAAFSNNKGRFLMQIKIFVLFYK